MKCEEAMELIYASLDGPASSGDEKDLSGHLRGCERCRTELRKLNRLEDVLKSVPEPPVSRTRLGETVGAVSSELRGRRGRPNTALWAGVAAAAVVALGTGLGWYTFGRRPAAPTEELPALKSEDLAAGRTGESPAREARPAGAPDSRGDAAPLEGGLLVERLVGADLALSEADGPGRKAAIFCAMSRDVLSALRDSADRDDLEGLRALGQGYTRLLRDGVLPNVKSAGGEEDRGTVSDVTDSLKRNCELLGSLVARTGVRERALLTEALGASEECLSAAEGVRGFF